ncbi:MAG TPA: putative porin [Candidatus Omnitrophota bacterium]|nr:putative porin [Candidatus Omnitrophota bacterium]
MKRRVVWQTFACFVFSIFYFSTPVMAQDVELVGLIKALQKQITDLQTTVQAQNAEIQELKAKGARIQVAPKGVEMTPITPMSEAEFKQRLGDATGGADKWLKDLKFKGDLRLRYEAFDNRSQSLSPNEADSRNRFRYRLRYGFEKKFSDQILAGFSLASGEAPYINGSSGGSSQAFNGDPTSTNTSFDSNFNFKPIYIEKAYATYTPNWVKIRLADGLGIDNLTITGGKMDNLFEKGSSEIMWDRDVKPEGFIQKIDVALIKAADFALKGFFTAGQFVLDEDKVATGASSDANLFAFQMGVNPVFYTPVMDRPIDLLSAVSYYDFGKYGQYNNWKIDGASGRSLARGNPRDPTNSASLAAGGFRIWETYNELAFYPMGIPVRPFFDYLTNTANGAGIFPVAGSNEDHSWAYGLKVGGIHKKGDWELGWQYRYVGANAQPGFNDSDFGYEAHSGVRGNVFKAGYGLTDYLTVNGAMYFVNNLNPGNTRGLTDTYGIEQRQNRFQVDLVWKF